MTWYERTKQPALVNTSFNKHEEPIICTSKDGFDALNDEIIDVLVLNDEVVLWKDEANQFMSRYEA
jgi:carbamoyltransferase